MRAKMSRLISTKQAAERLGLSQVHIRHSIHRKKLKATKIGHDWLIDANDLDTFNKHRQGPGNPGFGRKAKKGQK
jgi:excisionase family DNA binding protein